MAPTYTLYRLGTTGGHQLHKLCSSSVHELCSDCVRVVYMAWPQSGGGE